MRYHLDPLSERETKEYIEKRLRIAGAQYAVFSEDAIKEIYEKSGGIPRLVNIICDNALLSSYADDRKKVDRKSVREAAKDLALEKGPPVLSHRVRTVGLAGILLLVIILAAFYFAKTGHWILLYNECVNVVEKLKGSISLGFEYVSTYLI
jgi:general secretion pathway protein A